MAVLAAGHGVNDMSAGGIPALLPFLVTQRHLSYAAAAGLVLAFTIASSIGQPAFGHLADRAPQTRLMAAGMVLSGLGIGLIGVVPGYPLILAACVLSGVGVAAYHPEAARFANYVSGPKRATGMSYFSVGGGIGFALGPALITPLVLVFGLPGTLLMIAPSLAMAAVLLGEGPRLERFRPLRSPAAPSSTVAVESEDWSAFRRLVLCAMLRQVVYYAFITFAPLYFVRVFLTSPAHANAVLTAMLAAGALGTVLIGPLADRFGRRPALLGALAAVTVLGATFTVSGQLVATLAVVLIGGAIIGTFSTMLVMGQEYLPGHIGLASGLTLGLPDGVGGLSAPLLGSIADSFGLRAGLQLAVLIGVGALALAFTLPRGGQSSLSR
jgi:MFS transporter, FSR family, fosmidomycin resistance protein